MVILTIFLMRGPERAGLDMEGTGVAIEIINRAKRRGLVLTSSSVVMSFQRTLEKKVAGLCK